MDEFHPFFRHLPNKREGIDLLSLSTKTKSVHSILPIHQNWKMSDGWRAQRGDACTKYQVGWSIYATRHQSYMSLILHWKDYNKWGQFFIEKTTISGGHAFFNIYKAIGSNLTFIIDISIWFVLEYHSHLIIFICNLLIQTYMERDLVFHQQAQEVIVPFLGPLFHQLNELLWCPMLCYGYFGFKPNKRHSTNKTMPTMPVSPISCFLDVIELQPTGLVI